MDQQQLFIKASEEGDHKIVNQLIKSKKIDINGQRV